jgi:hypothetical protein
MKIYLETSIKELYKSTIESFPNTTKRQYATDPIIIEKLQLVPFKGVRTLFIKGLARSTMKKYECIMLFKNINYINKQTKGTIKIKTSTGSEELLERIESENNDVLVRCNCADFYWRGNYADHLDKSLFGRKRAKYESKGYKSVNPLNSPMICKHIIKLSKVLIESKILMD